MDDDFLYSADEDENVSMISSAWCKNGAGICVSFAIPIDVMDIGELQDFGKMFVDAVNESHKDFLDQYFYAKTDTPLVAANPDGSIMMLWSFQADDEKEVRDALKKRGIKEIEYD